MFKSLHQLLLTDYCSKLCLSDLILVLFSCLCSSQLVNRSACWDVEKVLFLIEENRIFFAVYISSPKEAAVQ